eukprot:CAMPEP_0172833726 /NCGR_PEP_ID=MMETSP1075-20121228/24562_1 /TAXON_ID=2916 /ORGANISM="Ceratium fusus, Strain PA161109" /LENGTH=39 /DNA_ID= /DNA_START= /DNA_END= /DNA_ORIENTATION=
MTSTCSAAASFCPSKSIPAQDPGSQGVVKAVKQTAWVFA